jgi:hypothetical protein
MESPTARVNNVSKLMKISPFVFFSNAFLLYREASGFSIENTQKVI